MEQTQSQPQNQIQEPRPPRHMTFIQKFVLFIRTQGVIGLAVAVVLGGAVQKVVTALVNDIINPLIGLFLGKQSDLKNAAITINNSKFAWGDLVSTTIDFLIIALVIYIIVKVVRADMLDAPKPEE